jgi:ribA/ribD-fused uncharacterized protein
MLNLVLFTVTAESWLGLFASFGIFFFLGIYYQAKVDHVSLRDLWQTLFCIRERLVEFMFATPIEVFGDEPWLDALQPREVTVRIYQTTFRRVVSQSTLYRHAKAQGVPHILNTLRDLGQCDFRDDLYTVEGRPSEHRVESIFDGFLLVLREGLQLDLHRTYPLLKQMSPGVVTPEQLLRVLPGYSVPGLFAYATGDKVESIATIETDGYLLNVYLRQPYGGKYKQISMETMYERFVGIFYQVYEPVPVVPLVSAKRELFEDIMARNDGDYSQIDRFVNLMPLAPEKTVDVEDDGTPVASRLAHCQEVYDTALPGISAADFTYDMLNMAMSDLDLELGPVLIREPAFSKLPRLTDDCLKPTLRTGKLPPRTNTGKETLLGLMKRNMHVSAAQAPSAPYSVAARAYNALLDKMCKPEARAMLDEYARRPACINAGYLAKWLDTLDGNKFDELFEMPRLEAGQMPLDEYLLTVKTSMKCTMDTKILHQYPKLQMVFAHAKNVNAVFSPVFLELLDRFQALLNPRVLCYIGYSDEQVEGFLNMFYDRSAGAVYLESDLSSYDKSLQENAHELKMLIYESLGMDKDLLQLWDNCHRQSIGRGFASGIDIVLHYQTKSGDASTAFGNTIVNMATAAMCFRSADYVFFMSLGDDNLVCTHDTKLFDELECTNLARDFNLECKLIVTRAPTFCGRFVVRTDNALRFMPDPVKRIEALGNKALTTYDEVRELFVSYRDLMSAYSSVSDNAYLSDITSLRYGVGISFEEAIANLYVLTRYYKLFSSSFFGVVLVRPSREPRMTLYLDLDGVASRKMRIRASALVSDLRYRLSYYGKIYVGALELADGDNLMLVPTTDRYLSSRQRDAAILGRTTRYVGDAIWFRGESSFLSNFYPCRFVVEGICFHSVEQYYQFKKCKTLGRDTEATAIMRSRDVRKIKATGNVEVTDEWLEIREDIMRIGLVQKFNEPRLRVMLEATKGYRLVEGTRDRYWGSGVDVLAASSSAIYPGWNRLGILLEELRDAKAQVYDPGGRDFY